MTNSPVVWYWYSYLRMTRSSWWMPNASCMWVRPNIYTRRFWFSSLKWTHVRASRLVHHAVDFFLSRDCCCRKDNRQSFDRHLKRPWSVKRSCDPLRRWTDPRMTSSARIASSCASFGPVSVETIRCFLDSIQRWIGNPKHGSVPTLSCTLVVDLSSGGTSGQHRTTPSWTHCQRLISSMLESY